MGYFMSKLVNYRRKTESIQDIRAMLTVTHPNDKGREALQLSLDQRMRELLASQPKELEKWGFEPKRKASYLEASRILGQMLGERLYNKYRKEKLNLKELQILLRQEVGGLSFLESYLMLQVKLSKKQREMKEG